MRRPRPGGEVSGRRAVSLATCRASESFIIHLVTLHILEGRRVAKCWGYKDVLPAPALHEPTARMPQVISV